MVLDLLRFIILSSVLGCCLGARCVYGQAAPRPLKVGVISSLDPVGAPWSESANLGLELAQREMMQLAGRERVLVELYFEDDRFDPKQAVTAYHRLVNTRQVDLIIGPQFEQTLTPVLPVARKDGILLITTIGSTPISTYEFPMVIHSVPPDKLAAKCLGEVINKDRRRRVMLVVAQESYSQTFAGFVRHALDTPPLRQYDYLPQTSDLRALLLKVKQEQPDALVFFFVTPEAAVSVFKQMRELSLKVPVYANEVLHNSKVFLQEVGAIAAGTTYCGIRFDENEPKIREFISRLPRRPILPMYSVVAYDTLRWLAVLFEQHGHNITAIHEAIFRMQFPGLLGTYRFDKHGDLVFEDFVPYTISEQGYQARQDTGR